MGRHYVIPGDDTIVSVVCAAIDRIDSILALHVDDPDEDPATTAADRSGEIAAAIVLGYAAVCKVAAAVRRGRTGASSWHTVTVRAKRRICVQQGGTP